MSQTRMTKQRAVILEALRSVTSHPTADEIYGMVRQRLPRISLGTVYRNLDLLTGTGEILCLDRAGAQKHFDGNTTPHMHVRCKLCGCIGDTDSYIAPPSPSQVSSPGFVIERAELEFIGICAECTEKQHNNSN